MDRGLPAAPCLAHDHDQEAPHMMIVGEAVEGGGTRETDIQGEGGRERGREREGGRGREGEREGERERERERERENSPIVRFFRQPS